MQSTVNKLALTAFAITVLYGVSTFAHDCGPMSLTLASNGSADYMITRCPSNPDARFKILDPGSANVATISLAATDGTEATYLIEAVAPGQTKFRVQYQTVIPPITTGNCNVGVTVTGL